MNIIFASSNSGKLRELNSLFKDLPFSIIPQSDQGVLDADETGLSFIENAILKARNACRHTQLPALADDSGLVIPALQGAPGIYSARYAGKDSTAQNNIERVLKELSPFTDTQRQAYFFCVMVFMLHAEDPTPLVCQGKWEGTILESQRGTEGFGYDPIFFVTSENKTAAELPLEQKNLLSHRGQALRQLVTQLPEKLKHHARIAS